MPFMLTFLMIHQKCSIYQALLYEQRIFVSLFLIKLYHRHHSCQFRCLINNIHSEKKNIKGLWKALLCAGISGLKMNGLKVFV